MTTSRPQPYGPETAAVRDFLVRLAGLGAADRATVVSRYDAIVATRGYEAADARLGEVITRSGRGEACDALSGPLMQLVKRAPESLSAESNDELALEPIAEPALAALLALVVRDLLDDATVRVLTDAFQDRIPLAPR